MNRKDVSLLALAVSLALAAMACGPLISQPEQPQASSLPPGESSATPEGMQPATEQPTEIQVEQATPEPGTTVSGVMIWNPQAKTITVVDPPTLQAAPFATLDFDLYLGPGPTVDAVQGKIYAIGPDSNPGGQYLYEITPASTRLLDDYGDRVQGIAVLPIEGAPDHPSVAFGTVDWQAEPPLARLMIIPVDGFDALLAAEQATPEGFYFLPVRWSEDGTRLYYSEEPSGLGGYIPFGGYSSLYVYDVTTNTSSVLMPQDVLGGFICLDDISPDEILAAHHCAGEGIGIVNLNTGEQIQVIVPPADLTDWSLLGSAKFSPDGSMIAYAVARGDPGNEQGYVLVAELDGEARQIAASPAGDYFTVDGWLDSNTLILQSGGAAPAVWLAPADSSAPTKLADGFFLDITE